MNRSFERLASATRVERDLSLKHDRNKRLPTDVNLFTPWEHEADCFQQHGHTSGIHKETCWTHGVPVVRWAPLQYGSRLLVVCLNLMELDLEWDATLVHDLIERVNNESTCL